jgi:4-diphosphocytidyl-2-C-methyl-D-erythritol kinase
MLAPAKINLCLFLGATRADGKHELVSVMQSLAWGDEVTAEAAEHDEVICPGVEGPNIASAALAAVSDDRPPLRIVIDKRIPVAAGLGGGSADAAAVLRLVSQTGLSKPPNTWFGSPTSAELAVAAALGADVPAQLEPGRSLATGAGEVVERLPPPPRFGVLVVPSEHRLSTADVYREADRLELPHGPADLAARLDEVRAGIGEGPFGLAEELLVNDLEPAALHLCPAIAAELDRVRALGADHVMVSGSGPTVLGLFADAAAAEAAAADLPGSVATTPLDS